MLAACGTPKAYMFPNAFKPNKLEACSELLKTNDVV